MQERQKATPVTSPASGLEWHTEKRRLRDLVEWDKNPRQLTEAQAAQLGESLRKFGYVEPIAINLDEKIIGGHMRRRVLMMQALLDPNAEVDVRVPSRALTQGEAEELAIRLNRNLGEWDFDKLANEFEPSTLIEWGFESWEFGMGDVKPGTGHEQDGASDEELRGVTLLLNVESLREFEQLAVRLAKRFGTDNVADTVLAAMREVAKDT